MNINKEDILKANRKAMREINLANNHIKTMSTKVHKSKKLYDRKKVTLDN